MVGRRWLAVVSAALVVVTGNLVVPQLAAPAFAAPAAVDDDPTVAGHGVAPAEEEPSSAEDATMMTAVVAEPPVWPEAASAVVKVPVPVGRAMPADTVPAEPVANVSVLADGAAPAAVRPGAGDADPTGPGPVDRATPLELNGLTAGGLSRVRVTGEPRELAEALGAAQVFRLQRADGVFTASAADVRVDYSGYAEAFGGNYADRLRIFQVPECALAAGSWSGCGTGPIPVESVNHPGRQTLTARLAVAGAADPQLSYQLGEPASSGGSAYMVMATGQGTSTGDYTATDLNPAGTWQVGLSSGAFTYSYPVPEPPLVAGSGLGLSLQYNSQSVDAFTQSTNNQSGWVGLGWSLSPGYIERKFRPCSEDVGDGSPKERSDQKYWGDLCWESPDENDREGDTNDPTNAELFLNLNGVSTRIVKDRVSGEWKTEQDHGWEIELISGGEGKDYWQISTHDGSRYRFGYTDGSNLMVSVVGDDPGEPGYDIYPSSRKEAWRWNLDRVIDANGNQIQLYWTEEVNYYKRWHNGNILSYARSAYLDKIEYGYNSSVEGSEPIGRVDFINVFRCVERTVKDDPVDDPYPSNHCSTPNTGNASSYPDVPVDLKCSSSSCSQFTPTFFSDRRLERITTLRRLDSGSWANIYRIHLRFKTLNPPGLTGKVLWLDRIFPVGLIGPDADKVRLPGVNFNVEYLSGRVDHGEAQYGVSEMILPRVYRVYNGYGGRTDVTYGQVSPCPTSGSAPGNDEYWDWYNSKVGNWDVNTDDCAPVWHKPEGAPAGWGQFHKYLALQVVDSDRVGDSPDVVTTYEYQGEAAWALGYGVIGINPGSESWNEWRGYPTVRVLTGSGTDPANYSMTETTFFRGLYYDYYDDRSTQKNVTITDYDGGVWSDYPGRAGKPVQVRNYRMLTYGPDPGDRAYEEISSSRYSYRWENSGDGPGWRNPRFADRSYERHRVKLDDGTWREESHRTTEFDQYGMPTEIVNWNDLTVSDNTCTSITYAQRDSGSYYMINYPEIVEVWGDDECGTGGLISRTVTLYDGNTSTGSQNPYDGNPTEIRTYTSENEYVAVQHTYDNYGRVVSTTDPVGQTTTITYAPAANWPHNGVTTTNALGQSSTVWLSPAHGQATRLIDANGKQTDLVYDQLGRLTEVYLPGDDQTAGIASAWFDYTYTWNGTTGQPTAPTRVGSHSLLSKANGGQYLSAYVFDDGFGRVRETQQASPAGGRVVTASYYDRRGLVEAASRPFHAAGDPGAGLVNPDPTTLPSWARHEYDALGRTTVTAAMNLGTELWRSTTTYHGDHLVVTPPPGGTTETLWVDVFGNTTLRQQHASGGMVDTAYTYDKAQRLVKVVDDAGNEWNYSYDLAGRKTSADDPDAGTSTFTYDAAGRVTATTDARGQTLSTDYDQLGRPISRWAGAVDTGTLLAEWVYDTLAAGQLTSATRWHDGHAYTTSITGYNDRYQPTGRTVSIPTAEGVLAGDYSYTYSYTDAWQPESVTLPAAGGLPAETLTTGYNPLGLVDSLTSDYGGGTTYVAATTYDSTGDLVQQLLGATGAQVARDLAWDQATGRLTGITTVAGADTGTPTTVQDDAYTYDPAGNVTSITDTTTGQAQCFTYDDLRRLVEAWTTTSAACGDGPSAAVVDGPDPYWTSWTYDNLGNRLSQVEHSTTGGADVTTSYDYPTPGSGQPHTLVGTTVTAPGGTTVASYTYDPAGNTISRPGPDGQQTLTWDVEGRLESVTDSTGTSEYLYDADGNRLIARDPDGTTTLYLPEGVELQADPYGVVTCLRYYGGIAVRTGATELWWQAADHHGTATYSINAATGQVVQRRFDPFGVPHSGGGSWPDDKGFLGKPVDPTGLTHIGAREYDPGIGRFISIDPIMNLADPQQMHGYAYANNNPVTLSDPTGLFSSWTSVNGVPCIDGDCSYHNADGSLKTKSQCKSTGGCGRGYGSSTIAGASASTGSGGGGDGGGGDGGGGTPPAPVDPDVQRALEIKAQTLLDVVLGAGGQILMEFFGINDILDCVQNGDIGACAWALVGALPLGKFLKAKKIIGAFWDAGKAVLRWLDEVKWADDVLRRCNSFLPGTAVLMADGSTKPIEQVEVGDVVLATDPETGQTEPKKVTATIIGEGDKDLVQVSVGLQGPAPYDVENVVVATGGHPFWVTSTDQWVDAADLQVGQWLQTSTAAEVPITAIEQYTQYTRVYNLTIADIHTYYVVAGNTPVLVHNTSACNIDPRTPTGSRGNPLRTNTPNRPDVIYGREYSGHALDRMQQQGIMPSAVESAVNGPAIPGKRPGTTAYYDPVNDLTVITDTASGRVVTVDYGRIRQ